MIWSFTTNEHGPYPQQAVPLETIPRKKKIWPTKDIMARGRPERYWQNGPGWTLEEAEVAAREWIVWRHLSSQTVSAVMHDAVQ